MELVWVIDKITGAGYPLAKSIADSDKDRYKQDPKHPVFDRNGNPLAPKSAAELKADQGQPDKAEEATK